MRTAVSKLSPAKQDPGPDQEPILPQDVLCRLLKLDRLGLQFLGPQMMRLLAVRALNRLYGDLAHLQGLAFVDEAIRRLGFEYQVPAEDLRRVPRAGRLVVVANHPCGGIDGLIMIQLLSRLRSDFKMMAAFTLGYLPALRERLIIVNQYNAGPQDINVAGLRETLRHLETEGCVGVFPAGGSSLPRWPLGPLDDLPWAPSIGRVVLRSRADVLPVYFGGSNGPFFNLLGYLRRDVRRSLVVRALFGHRGEVIPLRLRPVVRARELAACGNAEEVVEFLRACVYHPAQAR